MIVRRYAMTAAEGRDGELREALLTLAGKVRSLSGAVRVDVLRDQRAPADVLFLEA